MRHCKLKDCETKQHSKGYCSKHYSRVMRHGSPYYEKTKREMHGMSKHPLYNTWCQMKQRCYDKNKDMYCHYGGRGIRVCDKWRHSFKAFLKDMGDKPSLKHKLERVDNDGDYSPDNCIWATQSEQMWNTRPGRLNTSGYKGVSRIKKSGRWHAYVGSKATRLNISYFSTAEEAIQAVYTVRCQLDFIPDYSN